MSALAFQVRRLQRADLPRAVPLLHAEGWTFDEPDLARLLRVGGATGAFGPDGEMAAFLSFVDEPPLRWIGNVVTRPEARGHGLGARILEDATRDAPRAGLYAVEKAVTLYERAGFVAQGECFAHRGEDSRALRPSSARRFDASDLLDAQRLDREVSGVDRAYLLRELFKSYPETMRVVRRGGRLAGFGVAKTYPDVTEIGPVVATDNEAAELLLDALLAASPPPYEAAVLAANVKSLAAFRDRGFARAFRTIPMFRGEPPAWKPARLVAAAGLEKG